MSAMSIFGAGVREQMFGGDTCPAFGIERGRVGGRRVGAATAARDL